MVKRIVFFLSTNKKTNENPNSFTMSRITSHNIYLVLGDSFSPPSTNENEVCDPRVVVKSIKNSYRSNMIFFNLKVSKKFDSDDRPYKLQLSLRKDEDGRILRHWTNFYEVCKKTQSNPLAVRCELDYIELYSLDGDVYSNGEHGLILDVSVTPKQIHKVLSVINLLDYRLVFHSKY